MDDIQKAFENLTPEDLIRDTSAILIEALPEEAVGQEDFDTFVDTMLKASWAKAETDDFVGFTVLSNPIERRVFTPEDDETADHYAVRLRREADVMGATWFFNALTAPGRSFAPDAEVETIDVTDTKQILRALKDGTLSYTVCWSAILDEQFTYRRGGIIILDEERRPIEMVEGDLDPNFDPFRYVLGGDD